MPASVPCSHQILASSPVELAAGIDALYLSARGDVPPVLLDELDTLRERACELEEPIDAALAGSPVRFPDRGWGKYRFCFVHELARIGTTKSDKLPAARVQRASRALRTVGPQTTVLWARNLLDALGIDAVLQVSRLYLHSAGRGSGLIRTNGRIS